MKALHVSVLQSHIDRGRPKHCNACPIALALCESTGEYFRVGCDSAFVADDVGVRTWKLSPEAREFIRLFDSGERVTPVDFVLEFHSVVVD